MSRNRGRRILGSLPLRNRFFFERGMISDDTEHACMVGQALLRAPNDADAFARSLAWRLRFWLLGLPAGVGFATLRAVGKLWLGFSPANSGVFSAGNGPAMRAPPSASAWAARIVNCVPTSVPRLVSRTPIRRLNEVPFWSLWRRITERPTDPKDSTRRSSARSETRWRILTANYWICSARWRNISSVTHPLLNLQTPWACSAACRATFIIRSHWPSTAGFGIRTVFVWPLKK